MAVRIDLSSFYPEVSSGPGVSTTAGAVTISGAGQKTLVEMNQGNYSGPAGISVALPNAETGLKVKDGVFTGGNGSITLQTGSSSAAFGNIEVNQSRFSASSTVQITSGQGGKAIVDNVQLDGGQTVETNKCAKPAKPTTHFKSATNNSP